MVGPFPSFAGWVQRWVVPGREKDKTQGMEIIPSVSKAFASLLYSPICQTKRVLLPVFATYWLIFNSIIQKVLFITNIVVQLPSRG